MKNIICSPVHYVLEKNNTGSEFGWAYHIFEGLSADKHNKYYFVAGETRGVQGRNIYPTHSFDPDKINLSLQSIIKFYFKVFLKTVSVAQKIKGEIVLHHVLPFSIGNSFNLFALVSRYKFILGPVQAPLKIVDSDLNTSDLRSSKKGTTSLFSLMVVKTIRPIIRILSWLTMKRASKIICINDHAKNMLVKMGIDDKKIVIIPPGIDTAKFKTANILDKDNYSSTIELLSVGYLIKRKGVDLLIAAMSQVVKKNKEVRLRIIGDGPQKELLQDLVKGQKLDNYVFFEGNIPNSEIQKYYQKSNIFVSMSRSESWGQMYMEAMACGLPVISSINDGSRSIVSDGETGYLVEQENNQQLIKKILYLSENPEVRTAMGKAARKDMENKYDWEKVVIPKYLKIYESLA